MDHSSHKIIATGKCFSVGWQSYIYEVVEADGGRERLRSWIVSREAEGIKAIKRGSECLFESIELNVEYDL